LEGILEHSEGGLVLRGGGVPPAGEHDFVIVNGEMRFGAGHYHLAEGGRVEWAGTIRFDETGALVDWSNASGHYRPSASFADNAGLPMEHFRAVDFPAMVGGASLPVFSF